MLYISNKLKIIIIILIFIYQKFIGQEFINFRHEQKQKIDSIESMYQDVKRLKLYSLLPSLSYSPVNNNVNVGVDLQRYITYFQQNQRNKIELQKLKLTFNSDLDKTIQDFRNEYWQLKNEYIIFLQDVELIKLSREIAELKEEQFKKNKINLEDLLSARSNYQIKLKSVSSKKIYLIQKIKEFSIKTKSSLFESELVVLDFFSN